MKVIDQVHDAASSTFGVRLEMAHPEMKLPAGIKCKRALPAWTLGRGQATSDPQTTPEALQLVPGGSGKMRPLCGWVSSVNLVLCGGAFVCLFGRAYGWRTALRPPRPFLPNIGPLAR